MSIPKNIPNTWVISNVEDLCSKIHYGYTESAIQEEVGPKFLRITDIQNGRVNWNNVPYCKIEDKDKSKYLLTDGDILFARTGGTVGKSFLIDSVSAESVFASYLIRLVPHKRIVPKYIYYYFQSQFYWAQIELNKTGLKANVNAQILGKLQISLPPEKEQGRIADKIEELFSELDNSVASLKKAKEQLKVYRQSVLKHAFEGKLTAKWREENKDKLESADALLERIKKERAERYEQQVEEWKQAVKAWENDGKQGKKPSKPRKGKEFAPENSELKYNLPNTWRWVPLGQLISNIEAGKSFRCEERPPLEEEVGVAKVSAVTWGQYDEQESKTCLDPDKINESYFIKPSDFLFSRANTIELVGACVIARDVNLKVMLSDKTLRLNFLTVNERFCLWYLRSRTGRAFIESLSTGNQDSMRNIGQDRICRIEIPFCSLTEQSEVVEEIEQLLSLADALELSIDQALSNSDILRQGVLKQAFEGRLVHQDPSDEPASALLERVKDQTYSSSGDAKHVEQSERKTA